MGSTEHIIIEHIKKKEWTNAIPQILAEDCTDQQRDKIFNEVNGLERMAVYREILKSVQSVDNNANANVDSNSKYNVKYFLLLKPSEQGLVLEELDVNDIGGMLRNFNEAQRVSLFEVLPYNIIERITSLMTEDEKKAIGLLDDGESQSEKKGKCIII